MKTLVVFLGSRIAGDDTAGYSLYVELKDKLNARMEYIGTDLFRLYGCYGGEEKIIIVDAVYGVKDIIHLDNNEIFNLEEKSKDAHFISAIEALKILREVMENFPEKVHLIGIPAKNLNKVTYDKNMLKRAIKKLMEII
ncbi:MAG TPA: hydrogenase maturation protease [Thermoplasmatales archaeon]|nr:hydrogenase maturation protease [Thermoplasmatales archaeon]